MRKNVIQREFDELSVEEKIELVQALWDRIEEQGQAVDVTEAQRAELERRILAHEANPGQYTSWETLRHHLAGRKQ